MTLLLPSRRSLAPWLRDPLWAKARMVPAFDLDANYSATPIDKVSGLALTTFTRAATATFLDQAGVLQTAAANTLRRQWNPTHETWEWLVEPASTNVLGNSTRAGAVTGTPGTLPSFWSVAGFSGLTRQVVATGTFNGVEYVDIRFSGTTSGTSGQLRLETSNFAAASVGQLWHLSSWVQVVAGSMTNVTNLSLRNEEYSGVYLGESTMGATAAIDTSWKRVIRSCTTVNASTQFVRPYLSYTFNNAAAVDITVRIGLPQMELGLPTSPIKTSGSAVTRDADIWTCSGASFSRWFNGSQGTVFLRGREYPYYTTVANRYFYDFAQTAAPNNNFIRQWIWTGTSTSVTASIYSAGAISAEVAQVATDAPKSTALAYAFNSVGYSYNQLPPEVDNSVALPSSIDQLRLGGPLYLGGGITRFTYFPRRLPEDTLARLTD